MQEDREQTPDPAGSGQEQAAAAAPRPRRVIARTIRGTLAVLAALVAALLVSGLTVDLGPSLRGLAERQGSKFIERPMHIGRLSARLTPGVFVIDDLVIEGLSPTDRPFLKAGRITVRVPWWTAFSRRLIIESITMTDWTMVVETFPDGRHNFPKFTRSSNAPKGPSRFTTTLRSVVAERGEFTFDDHVTPWTTTARNLTVQVYRPPVATTYLGRASFENGTVRIQSYEPFRTDMQSRFTIDGGVVRFQHMDLIGDGSQSVVTGSVDLAHWPEQIYQVHSRIDFPTQKSIFFHGQDFTVTGSGSFDGTFHLFKGGRELKGTFSSPVAGVNQWRFPNLRGSVLWLPDRLEITNARSDLYGGTARFDYRMAPFGHPGVPTEATWDVQYSGVDLRRVSDLLALRGMRVAGRASGRNRLQWPLGKWALKRGGGEITIAPPEGVVPMTRALPPPLLDIPPVEPLDREFDPHLPLGYVPMAGRLQYTLDPSWITLGPSWTATSRTYVEFEGRTAYGQQSRIPFHVTSADWQESDRLLAGIMTAFGASTGAIEIGGRGEFDGVMLAAFTRPRIEGRFSGDRLRAWDVEWGHATADVVIENSYALVSNAVMTSGASEIQADGQFSLGYPRRDGGEQIDARVRITSRPLVDLRHAFELDDYPVSGTVSGDFHVYGEYERPYGYGKLIIQDGVAYGEPFERATSPIRLEGNGVRLDTLEIEKSTGKVTGAAFVSWEGEYSFNADGTRIPVESIVNAAFPRAPLSGLMQFTASGAGTFDEPRYDVKARVDDLFAGDEGIGQLNGRLAVRGTTLTLDLEAASPRLVVSGTGRIALTGDYDSELSVRFADTSLDPYVRFFEPRLSPFTNAVAGGTVRVSGPLADVNRLAAEAHVEQLDLKLFDYRLANSGTIDLALRDGVVRVDQLRLAGEGTALAVSGLVSLRDEEVAIEASGDANLGILQAFYRDVRSRGTASVTAQIVGPVARPVFSGSATIADGRIRVLSAPHSLEAINGRLTFDAGGIRVEDVAARLGEGDVHITGRIGLNGFAVGDLSLTATGERMRIRYPEGVISTIDANLTLQGPLSGPLLSGSVLVRDASWSRRIEASPDLFNLSGGGAEGTAAPTAPPATTLPLRLDIDITAPSTLRIDNNIAQMVASADLKLQGTYDRPQLFGHAEVERGDILFEGNRYLITRGAVDFFNAARIEPVFDIEAETRVRLPGQTYRVTLGFTGTTSRASFTLDSDPPLPEVDIIALLLGQATDLQNAELRALQPGAAQQSEEVLLRQAFSRLLTNPLSAPVSRILGETFGLDTVIAPTLGTESDPLTPSARLIIGRRLSSRAYITFARALGTTQRDQIIILEYDQNDRVGWVLTQNGDRTFAIDFRVRHRF